MPECSQKTCILCGAAIPCEVIRYRIWKEIKTTEREVCAACADKENVTRKARKMPIGKGLEMQQCTLAGEIMRLVVQEYQIVYRDALKACLWKARADENCLEVRLFLRHHMLLQTKYYEALALGNLAGILGFARRNVIEKFPHVQKEIFQSLENLIEIYTQKNLIGA